MVRQHLVPLEPSQARGAFCGPLGGRLPLGALSGHLARKSSAHGQQRLSSTRASLRLENTLEGRKEARVGARRSPARYRNRRTAAHSRRGGGDGVTEALAIGGLVVLAASAVVYVVSASSLWKLVRAAKAARATAFTPPVTIVKPLCGTDEGLETNLESFFRLDYPTGAIEVIFSMASAEDPAAAVARRVADRYPGIPSTFVFDAREPGGNAKVNRLEAAVRHAKFRLILFSDGNVRVRPDFLRRAVAEFEDPGVGLVSHLFRATGAVSFGSRLEALYLNGCLQPGTAAIARLLKMPCVVGKSILISRRALDGIGGISVLRDFLAEDYLLGRRIVDSGHRVVLSGDMLDTTEVRKPARAVWARHRRRAMMRRR